jgi:hypothetical protein
MSVVAYDPPRDQRDSRICGRCRRAWGSILVDPPEVYFPIQNARTDKYHSGGDFGKTDCGLDATGDEWRWPL